MGFFGFWRASRAFRRLPRDERRIVFFSESAQDWHHFATIIRFLADELERTVCYVSSDPADPGLHQDHPRIRPFCVGSGLFRIIWFQTLDCDVMATQLLDLDNFDLKRSVHPVHYVYLFHSLISTHMADHADSFDHYDTIFCAGPHQAAEIRKREALHGLPAKKLVEHGYFRLEDLLENRREPPPPTAAIHVLLAPSWGPETILNLCGAELVGILLGAGFRVTLRPHYQTRWNTPEVLDEIVARFGNQPGFRLVEDMGESDSLFDSHVMITDWSGAGMDYGMGLEKPVLYIDVPPKSRNDSWPELGMEPFEAAVRSRIGAILPPAGLADAPAVIRRLLADPGAFRAAVHKLRDESVFNLGCSTEAAATALAAIADEVADARGAKA